MIGIRREDKNEWERRVALTPDHVSELTRFAAVRVRVQPSGKRAFPDIDYRNAGAEIDEDLSPCATILGIKEIPEERLLPGKTYFFFSHTIKGQPANMPMLRRLLELDCTLVDYECIVNDRGRRLIFFGRHAGYAGMIDALWALGRRFDAEGLDTPFERIRLAHDYSSLDEATHHISRIGERIRHEGLPPSMRPIVFGFTGSGNVSLGAQEIYDRLPVVELSPEELAGMAQERDRPQNVLYKVQLERHHRFERLEGGPVDLAELTVHPERYRSRMAEWLPHLTGLVNGVFWTPPQPRLVTNDDLAALWDGEERPKLRIVADITFDIRGSIEATLRATVPDAPVYLFDVATRDEAAGFTGRGPLILAVDNLPCQLPAESSQHFGDTLLRFLPTIARCDWDRPFAELERELPPELSRAVIVHRGALTPRFSGLESALAAAGI